MMKYSLQTPNFLWDRIILFLWKPIFTVILVVFRLSYESQVTYARTGTSSLQYVFFYAMGKSGVGATIMCIHKICLQWCLTDNFIQLPKNINSFIKAFGVSMFDDS